MAHINEFLSHIDFDAMRGYCMANGRIVSYAKGDCFAETGSIGRYVGFVKSGYFKYCVLTSKGDYAVTGFSFDNECIVDFTQSFLFGKPSKISIVAGCDSTVVQVSLESMRDYLLRTKPELISQISAVVLEEAYGRYLNLHRMTPTERYLEIVKKYPDLMNRVPLRDIASFLLVTPTYLSRIRKSLCK